jgi:alpha-D-xyloside xylohydrolase
MAGWTTQNDYTMMRPLVMDFPGDPAAREQNDEYIFGPALLVAPVGVYKQRSRMVYLPPRATWYDFWTGRPAGTGRVTAQAPYDQIPVFVRAGSIIPFAPVMQYVGEKPCDPITLYVYAGADGQFALYEDQGTTFDYEKGAFSRIPIRWNDKTGELTIGQRSGSFDGMLHIRTFNVVMVSTARPAGFSFTPSLSRSVTYTGAEIRLKLQQPGVTRPSPGPNKRKAAR